jgi:hypothetical protein
MYDTLTDTGMDYTDCLSGPACYEMAGGAYPLIWPQNHLAGDNILRMVVQVLSCDPEVWGRQITNAFGGLTDA